jgi:hypothetical protein
MWVGASSSYNLYSYDGINWIFGYSFPSNINTFSNKGNTTDTKLWLMGTAQIIGSTAQIYYSYDGKSWDDTGCTLFTNCKTIKWSGDIWMAGGSGTNVLAYSINGTSNWISINCPLNVTVNGINRNSTNIPALTTLDSDVVVSLPTSNVNVSSPLGITKGGTDYTGTDVSIFGGETLNISGPTNTLQVDSPLKLTAAGVNQTGNPINPYINNLKLQLNTANAITSNYPLTLTVNGVDKSGQYVALDTPNQNISIDLNLNNFMNTIYPVGSILFSIDGTNPQSRFGGTWVQIASGRFIVGVGGGSDDNNQVKTFTARNNSGEYQHKLTIDEMPRHNHTYDKISLINNGERDNNQQAGKNYTSTGTSYTGGDGYHNNTPPGFGMYAWERTALA